MLTIRKYPLPYKRYFSLDLPIGAKIISIQEQKGKPQMWVLMNPEKQMVSRNFCILETGATIEEEIENLISIATYQDTGANVVAHIFEIISA